MPRCFHAIFERQVFIQHALADVLAIGVLTAAAIASVVTSGRGPRVDFSASKFSVSGLGSRDLTQT